MFGSETGLERFNKASNKAFNIFQQTCSDLEAANKLGDQEVASREEIITKVQQEKEEILAVQAKNSKVIDKIKKFFSDED